MQDARICLLFARKLSGEATPAELDELHAHLQHNSADQYLFDLLVAYWPHTGPKEDDDELKEEQNIQRILQLAENTNESITSSPPFLNGWKRWIAYAAAIILIAGTAALYHYLPAKAVVDGAPSHSQTEVVARPGSRTKMILPDGSSVWLNADSRLRYRQDFDSTLREVYLEGEGFFEVQKNPNRPFIVHTSGIDIKVLGTAFNVKSYSADATIETTLLHGSVEVVKKNDPSAPKLILQPNEKLVYDKRQGTANSADFETAARKAEIKRLPAISVVALPHNKPDSLLQETSWRYNKLIFDGDTFEELAVKMERWYNVSIVIRGDKLRQFHFKGSFTTESVRQALEALKLTASFKYKISTDEIEIFKENE